MDRRQELQDLLEALLDSEDRVYFQPPSGHLIKYPAIVFNLDFMDTEFAGNRPYRVSKRWIITYIDRSPTSTIPDKIAALPTARFQRTYRADGLNHYVFTIYF